jgi:hypothetical protein
LFMSKTCFLCPCLWRMQVKQATSIFMGALATTLLGFAAWTGGFANSSNETLNSSAFDNADDKPIGVFSSLASGYGKFDYGN